MGMLEKRLRCDAEVGRKALAVGTAEQDAVPRGFDCGRERSRGRRSLAC